MPVNVLQSVLILLLCTWMFVIRRNFWFFVLLQSADSTMSYSWPYFKGWWYFEISKVQTVTTIFYLHHDKLQLFQTTTGNTVNKMLLKCLVDTYCWTYEILLGIKKSSLTIYYSVFYNSIFVSNVCSHCPLRNYKLLLSFDLSEWHSDIYATMAGSDEFIKGQLHVKALVKGHNDTMIQYQISTTFNRINKNNADVHCCIFHLNPVVKLFK